MFHTISDIPPITTETASGESFTANQRGTICTNIVSDPSLELPDVPIHLTDVIYAPKLKVNLLSVGRMTSSNVNVMFSKYFSSLTLNGSIIAYGPKINNLFTYTALAIPAEAVGDLSYILIGSAGMELKAKNISKSH